MADARILSPDTSAGAAPIVVWFRDDLRLGDNPAFHEAAETGRPLVCIYVEEVAGKDVRPLGGASRWWLHGSLLELDKSLQENGGRLLLFRGAAEEILPFVVAACQATAIFWNRRYLKAARRIDEDLKDTFKQKGIDARSFNGYLLYEPWTVSTSAKTPFKVFSPFWRAAQTSGEPGLPLPEPLRVYFHTVPQEVDVRSLQLEELRLEPASPDWAGSMRAEWQRSERGAQSCLNRFIDEGFAFYAESRDRPDLPATSRLSPYLRFGNISARQVWHRLSTAAYARGPALATRNLEKFQSELGWREFSYHLLYHNPDMAKQNFQRKFDDFGWRSDPKALAAWRYGRTGYPLVDAGMRELWATGYMHNRVRMVAASFLVKDLLIDWREGEAWFWDTLVDADPANNAASWQWVAGSGADAAPFFRIFNPVLQGEKFDPDGTYVRRWVPELAHLPSKFIHRPWDAPEQLRLHLGDLYPDPVIDHGKARARALEALSLLQ